MDELKCYEDEIELKKMLDSYGYRYGILGTNDKFIVLFRDKTSGAPLSQAIYDSPIVAIRDLNVIIPQLKIPLKDIAIQLVMMFNPSDKNKSCIEFKEEPVFLSPYLYFEKKEIVQNEVKEDDVHENEKK